MIRVLNLSIAKNKLYGDGDNDKGGKEISLKLGHVREEKERREIVLMTCMTVPKS